MASAIGGAAQFKNKQKLKRTPINCLVVDVAAVVAVVAAVVVVVAVVVIANVVLLLLLNMKSGRKLACLRVGSKDVFSRRRRRALYERARSGR